MDSDVVLPAAVHRGEGQEELGGAEGARVEGQRDLQQGVKPVGLALLHQDAHAEGLVPQGLLRNSSPALGCGEDVRQRRLLVGTVSEGVGRSQSPRGSAQGPPLVVPLPRKMWR